MPDQTALCARDLAPNGESPILSRARTEHSMLPCACKVQAGSGGGKLADWPCYYHNCSMHATVGWLVGRSAGSDGHLVASQMNQSTRNNYYCYTIADLIEQRQAAVDHRESSWS